MKISIRKGMFETNSSSTHAFFLTNEIDYENDMQNAIKEIKEDMFAFETVPAEEVRTKEDKAYFLAGCFEEDIHHFCFLEDVYKIFLQILEDNKEEEILKNIKKHKKEYKRHRNPYCSDYFYNGTLSDCNCGFCDILTKYFDIKDSENKKEELYKKLYDFIYGDGIIVPYDKY